MAEKPDLSSFTIPESKKRRGSFVVRAALHRVALPQNRHALKAASRMVLALPLIQIVVLVGILNAEIWMALLGLEGLLIAWLAAAQLSRPNPESKLLGYGITLLNTILLGATGLFLGSHVFWLIGLLGLLPITWLVFSTTKAATVKRSWLLFAVPLLLVAVFCGVGRMGLVLSETEADPAKRRVQLDVAWYAMTLRGANGSERALLRLRQSQAAFAAGDYDAAFVYAHDGVYTPDGRVRGIPVSLIGADLMDSLLRVKAQAFYNAAWRKDGTIFTPIAPDPLEREITRDATVAVRWGW
jgi:hypothetical protein